MFGVLRWGMDFFLFLVLQVCLKGVVLVSTIMTICASTELSIAGVWFFY